jgi:hypothetical protein
MSCSKDHARLLKRIAGSANRSSGATSGTTRNDSLPHERRVSARPPAVQMRAIRCIKDERPSHSDELANGLRQEYPAISRMPNHSQITTYDIRDKVHARSQEVKISEKGSSSESSSSRCRSRRRRRQMFILHPAQKGALDSFRCPPPCHRHSSSSRTQIAHTPQHPSRFRRSKDEITRRLRFLRRFLRLHPRNVKGFEDGFEDGSSGFEGGEEEWLRGWDGRISQLVQSTILRP